MQLKCKTNLTSKRKEVFKSMKFILTTLAVYLFGDSVKIPKR